MAAVLFVAMVLIAAAVGGLARGHYRQRPDGPPEGRATRRVWMHGLGCVGFFILPIPLIIALPDLPGLVAAIFLYMTATRVVHPRSRDPRAFWILLLCSAVWLMDWGYEKELEKWGQTVHAPIRSDLVLVAPVLYFVSAVGISIFLQTFPTNTSEGQDAGE